MSTNGCRRLGSCSRRYQDRSHAGTMQAIGRRTSQRTHPLSHPDDPLVFSELMCLVRSQIEIFVVVAEDEEEENGALGRCGGGGGGGGEVGRVGIRCKHCAASGMLPSSSNNKGPFRGAVWYPLSVRLVYQAVRNLQRYHFEKCPTMPPDVRTRHASLKAQGRKQRSAKASPKYWEESCRKTGMIDREGGGIELRDGRFEFVPQVEECKFLLRSEGKEVEGDADFSESRLSVEPLSVDAVFASTVEAGANSRNENSRIKTGEDSRLGIQLPPGQSHHGTAGGKREYSKEVQVGSQLPSEQFYRDTASGTIINEEEDSGFGSQVSQLPSGIFQQNSESTPVPTRDQQSRLACTSFQRCDGSGSFGMSSYLPKAAECTLEEAGQIAGKSLVVLAERPVRKSTEGFSSAEDTVMEKLRTALHLVQAAGEIRPLSPPQPLATPEDQSGASHTSVDSKGGCNNPSFDGDVPPLVGAELYELFAGSPPYDAENSNSDLGNTHDSSSTKRGRRTGTPEEQGGSSRNYAPLGALGIPPAICGVVSSLLDGRGGERDYRSLSEVEEDIRTLMARPRLLEGGSPECGVGELCIARDAMHGREEEVSVLLDAFHRATVPADGNEKSGRREMVLVSGYSGTGKSSLVTHVSKALTARGASFVSGKFDAMRQLQPLSAVVSALGDYCDLLARDSSRIESVRELVTVALGSDGGVLANLVPNMSKIMHVGNDPPIPMSGREVMQRLVFQLRWLFRATCSREHPVVLCLDDLQWADEVSLKLLQALLVDTEIEGLLFVACFRDNEVDADHPLATCLEKIRRSGGITFTSIHLGNLDAKSLNALVSDTLNLTLGTTRTLAEAVLTKTGGNALFATQFLASLCDEGLLRFSLYSRRWEWDIALIRSKDVSDSVAELMLVKMLRLAPEVQEALRVAAAFGSNFHESLFDILDRSRGSASASAAALDIAVMEGLLVKTGSLYRFSHDQIQSASYRLIEQSEQASFHLSIGRMLLEFATDGEMDACLFVVVDQLIRGSDLIADQEERMELCRLSLKAGHMASAMSAFLPAAAYLQAGIGLLSDEDWDMHRDICFDLYDSCAETEFILGDFDSMQIHSEQVLARAETLQEKLRPNFTLVQSQAAKGNVIDAINTGLTMLSQLGEHFPGCITSDMTLQEISSTQEILHTTTEEDLLSKLMVDASKLEAMKFLQVLWLYAFTEGKQYFPFIVCRMVRLSLQYGICKESAFGFTGFSSILLGRQDFAAAYPLGKTALHIISKFQAKKFRSRVLITVYGMINPVAEPMQSSLPHVKDALEIGLQTGDIECAMSGAHLYVGNALVAGVTLDPLMKEVNLFLKQMHEYKQQYLASLMKENQRFIMKLQGRLADPFQPSGDQLDDLDGSSGKVHTAHLRSVFDLWFLYLLGEYEHSWCIVKDAAKGNSDYRVITVITRAFYTCLTAFAMAHKEQKGQYMETATECMNQMKIFAEASKWNCLHKLRLLEAEHAYLHGADVQAASAYADAVELAKKHSFVHEQALALERFGMFHLKSDNPSAASECFTRAYECYYKWGAWVKAAQVKERYL